MVVTKHAEKVKAGIFDFTLSILREYGRCERAPGGAVRLFFGEKEISEDGTGA